MSDKFNIDDILAQYKKNVKETGSIDRKPSATDNAAASAPRNNTSNTQEISGNSLKHLRAELRQHNYPDSDSTDGRKTERKASVLNDPLTSRKQATGEKPTAPAKAGTPERAEHAESQARPEKISLSEKPHFAPQPDKQDVQDDFKPTEPLFSMEQMRRIADERKRNISSPAKPQAPATTEKSDDKKPSQGITSILSEAQAKRDAQQQQIAHKPAVTKKPETEITADKGTDKPSGVTDILNEAADKKAEKKGTESGNEAKPPVAAKKQEVKSEKKPAVKTVPAKPATIFGNPDDAEKPKAEQKATVSVNTSGTVSFKERIMQYRFLFEELTKRDFKKKYKRTFLGVLWSVISPFFTFLIQFFVFGSLFNRNDSNYVIYLLTGTLMFHFFSDATHAGMFSMYANAGVLSKIKVPKTIFLLSSNVASVFNFMLTLLVYFVFMVICGVNFGPHLLLMLYPIICLIIFNIGISYILSALFVFFRDIQYLYSIVIMLLTYMSAIFYYPDRFPENFQFVFAINPVYRYIAYIRQLVIDSTIPSLTSHLMCFGFAAGALILGYLFHKKTEKNFVYYY